MENTLAAMEYAAPHVDLLEFDLARTADRELVLMHDLTLDRTTNCSGKVSAWSLADLRAQCTVRGEPIPTFDEVAAYAASVGKPIAPELKNAYLNQDDLAQVVAVIQAHGLAGRTWVQSRYGKHLVSLRGLAPQLRLALVSRAIPAVGTVRAAKATVVAVRLDLLNLPRVRRYHSARDPGVGVHGADHAGPADGQGDAGAGRGGERARAGAGGLPLALPGWCAASRRRSGSPSGRR